MDVTVIKSVKLSMACMVLLQHYENGLPAGTVLISKLRGLKWKVKHRQVFLHTLSFEKNFDNETVQIARVNAGSYANDIENRGKKTMEMNERNEFEYAIIPVDHDEKPLDGEVLTIE